jgi:hypothetical protein
VKRRPSFGRSRKERGLDQCDTPPIALAPLFVHEPLLRGVTEICEPFCGKGNLVLAMRARGIVVHASDIVFRDCPDSTVQDFRSMTRRPAGCDVLLSNPPFADAMDHIEHAFSLGFRIVIFLLKSDFFCTNERFQRLHMPGHLLRVYPLAERLQDMHDANFAGKKASQSQTHAWHVLDRGYCGPATICPVSIHAPELRMPWQRSDNGTGYHGPRGTSRAYVLHRLTQAGLTDLATQLKRGEVSVREALSRLAAAKIETTVGVSGGPTS